MGKTNIKLVNKLLLFIILILQHLLIFYCSKDNQGSQGDQEQKIEFPENANTVVILGQSSHLDISWVYTSEEYYEKLVKDIFLNSIDFVKSHKNHRVFFAEIFWIDKFLKKEEKEGNELLSLIKDGKIKIEGGGVGTDDWVVIPTEGIIRNYMTGRSWLKKRGLKIPKDAWVPDFIRLPSRYARPTLLFRIQISSSIKSKWIYSNTRTSESNNRKRFC